jgi:hypothetical protein
VADIHYQNADLPYQKMPRRSVTSLTVEAECQFNSNTTIASMKKREWKEQNRKQTKNYMTAK